VRLGDGAGPWFRELVELCGGGEWDIGVHLTLTSEWPGVRWAPVSTLSRASGLIDDDGYFPRDVATLRRQVVPEAAEAEMRAQIERAIAAGLRPTHVDAHMAAAMLPGLLEIQVRLAREYGLFPVLPRSITWAPDLDAYRAALAELDADGAPVVDHCRGTQPVAPVGDGARSSASCRPASPISPCTRPRPASSPPSRRFTRSGVSPSIARCDAASWPISAPSSASPCWARARCRSDGGRQACLAKAPDVPLRSIGRPFARIV
jgi:hypothetical protein